MKKLLNLKYQSSIIILTTLIFTICGYFYNQSIPQKWYFKYSIEETNASLVYVNSIDSTFNSINIGGTNVVKSFLNDKIYRQAVLNENPFFQNLEVSPQTIAFYTEGSLENLNANLDNLLFQMNKNIHSEVKDFVTFLEETTLRVSELTHKIKRDELGVALEYYEREGIEPVGFTEEIINIVDLLHARDDLTQTVRSYLLRLSALLNDLKNTTSTQFLELELEKLEKLGNIKALEFGKVKNIYKMFENNDILKINGLIEKKNLKPSWVTTSTSFAIFGITLSLLFILFIGIFSRKINIKKLLLSLSPK